MVGHRARDLALTSDRVADAEEVERGLDSGPFCDSPDMSPRGRFDKVAFLTSAILLFHASAIIAQLRSEPANMLQAATWLLSLHFCVPQRLHMSTKQVFDRLCKIMRRVGFLHNRC